MAGLRLGRRRRLGVIEVGDLDVGSQAAVADQIAGLVRAAFG